MGFMRDYRAGLADLKVDDDGWRHSQLTFERFSVATNSFI